MALSENDLSFLRKIRLNYDEFRKWIESGSDSTVYGFLFSNGMHPVTRTFSSHEDWIKPRIESMEALFNLAAKIIEINDLYIAVKFYDKMEGTSDFPVLSYHKHKGQNNTILIPDFEIFWRGFYAQNEFIDRYHFYEKTRTAIFYGSTTGTNWNEDRDCWNTVKNIAEDPSVRIEAAKFFNNSNNVIFKLPNIVQCDSEDAIDFLKSFDFTKTSPVDLSAQLKSRFLISLDGNGPTLSRVATALLSNSVLLKYRSRWITYYHRLLSPYRNFVPIDNHDDVCSVVNSESSMDELYHIISRQSSLDFTPIFSKPNVVRYLAVVLNEFNLIFKGESSVYWKNRSKIDQCSPVFIEGHQSRCGDIFDLPGDKITAFPGNWIEGITLWPCEYGFIYSDVVYSVYSEGIGWSDEVTSGCFCGSIGLGKAIYGVRIRIEKIPHFRYRVEYTDGMVIIGVNGSNVYHDAPVRSVTLLLNQ